jgi:hypothetical protein
VSEPRLTNPWEPWQRLLDAIGPDYRRRLYKARQRARVELEGIDEQQLTAIASKGRTIAATLDVEGARLTVSLNDDRERESRLASTLQAESEAIARQARWTVSPRRRRQARADTGERAAQAEEHRRMATHAHERLRDLGQGGRHLYPWFEQHEGILALGLAAELSLEVPHRAVYHVLGAPSIASFTAACLTSDRSIDIYRLERLVKEKGDARQTLLFQVAAELYGSEEGVSLSELLAELEGEDLDRVLQAIAMVKRRRLTIPESPRDLWIRAAEPEE